MHFGFGMCALTDGPYCINVAKEPPLGNACAETIHHGDPTTGVTNVSPRIRVRSDGWDQTYLNAVLAHELGHALGLDKTTCQPANSIMWEGLTECGTLPEGASTVPTPSNVQAMMTPYRAASRATCPVQ